MGDQRDIKISLSALGVSISTLLPSFRKDPACELARRFIQLFKDHGIEQFQIPEIFREIPFSAVASPQTLFSVLTIDVIHKAAKMFGVQKDWILGATDAMYAPAHFYQSPSYFFQRFGSLKRPRAWMPIRMYTVSFDLKNRYNEYNRHPLAITFAEQICGMEENGDIAAYRPFTEEWNWNYPPERIQLKAMLQVLYEELNITKIPLCEIKPNKLKEIAKGSSVPPNPFELPRIDILDYAVPPNEFRQVKEPGESEYIQEYIKAKNLREAAVKIRMDDERFAAENPDIDA